MTRTILFLFVLLAVQINERFYDHQTVDKIMDEITNHGVLYCNTKSQSHVDKWKLLHNFLYDVTKTGYLQKFTVPATRPHVQLKKEIKSMLAEFVVLVQKKEDQNSEVSFVEERAKEMHVEWIKIIKDEMKQKEREQSDAANLRVNLENIETSVGIVPQAPNAASAPTNHAIDSRETRINNDAGTAAIPPMPPLPVPREANGVSNNDANLRHPRVNQGRTRDVGNLPDASLGTRTFLDPTDPNPRPRQQQRRSSDVSRPQTDLVNNPPWNPTHPYYRQQNVLVTMTPNAGHRAAPNARHVDAIDRVDNGNMFATQNIVSLSSLLNSRERAAVQTSQVLQNLGGFMNALSNNAAMNNNHGNDLNNIVTTLLTRLGNEVDDNNHNQQNRGNQRQQGI